MGSRSFANILVPDSLLRTGSKGTASLTGVAPRALPGTDASVLLCASTPERLQSGSQEKSLQHTECPGQRCLPEPWGHLGPPVQNKPRGRALSLPWGRDVRSFRRDRL